MWTHRSQCHRGKYIVPNKSSKQRASEQNLLGIDEPYYRTADKAVRGRAGKVCSATGLVIANVVALRVEPQSVSIIEILLVKFPKGSVSKATSRSD